MHAADDEPATHFVLREALAAPAVSVEGVVRPLALSAPAASAAVRLIKRCAAVASNEALFRKDLRLALFDSQLPLDRQGARFLFTRAVAWWRQAAEDGKLSAVSARQRIALRAVNFPEPRLIVKAQLHVPAVSARRAIDPSRFAFRTRRALPAGSVRVHFSHDRNAFVRAMKREDGSWQILGKVSPPVGAHATPALPKSEEHSSSSPPGQEPHQGVPAEAEVFRDGKS